MKISVVIVNYNVKHFLEQCLSSAEKALTGIEGEIIVVDNQSKDGSIEMLQDKFPTIRLIANKENKGFSVANNQGIKEAKGEYILLLNPDTVIEEDGIKRTIQFMNEHPKAGALGVKMLDGKGNFLPESKRGLPTPWVAFCKMFGLSKLFPKSELFNQYYLGYLDENKINEVGVLSGAFMLIRKNILDKIGLLDESFFMYGEDIDLSYRITQAGYKNYYYPETKIIHYKGESTKKGSLNYVKVFYTAMILFAEKHFKSSQAKIYTIAIKIAIYIKAISTILNNILGKILLPLSDATVIYLGMYLIKDFWEESVKANSGTIYPKEYLLINIPLYIIIWLVSVFFNGGYDKPLKVIRLLRGLFWGTIIIAAVYGFLEESYRFSRGMILLGSLWAGVFMLLLRIFINFFQKGSFKLEEPQSKRIVTVGSHKESNHILQLLNQSNIKYKLLGNITPDSTLMDKDHYIGTISQLTNLIELYRANEIIFCSKDISFSNIIHWMTTIGKKIDYKIFPPNGQVIIGSNSKNTLGELYADDSNINIIKPQNRRNKRVLDLFLSGLFIVTYPVLIFLVKNPFKLIQNIFQVLLNIKSWVGYAPSGYLEHLPKIKPGILSSINLTKANSQIDIDTIYRLNKLYAKDYSVENDIIILFRNIKNLGR